MRVFKEAAPELIELAAKAGGKDVTQKEMFEAQGGIAKAIEQNIREGIFSGDIINDIYTMMPLAPNQHPEFELASLAPGEENDFAAFTIPSYGAVPSRLIQSDYVMLPTYTIGNSVEALLRHIRESRVDQISKLQTYMQMGFVKKLNDDGWRAILAAALDRDILVYDADAAVGQFTKRLVSLMRTVMMRNGGGNSTSPFKSKLTDMYVSPESIEDVRNWTIDQLDETTRREVYMAGDGASVITRIFGVNLHPLHELGEGQQYQTYYTSTLGGVLAPTDVELVIGLDMQDSNTFVMPVKQQPTIFVDESAHKEQLYRLYGWAEVGFGILDTRRIIAGSY